ncbi:hypothetical protein ABEB36_004828 [Hypothenemus hampei]|uniref:Uncharacterized protein n=1 Tax=Hypothenemus hampei TaxID=57062 RepID=A0ABD1EZW4_HYPHA
MQFHIFTFTSILLVVFIYCIALPLQDSSETRESDDFVSTIFPDSSTSEVPFINEDSEISSRMQPMKHFRSKNLTRSLGNSENCIPTPWGCIDVTDPALRP